MIEAGKAAAAALIAGIAVVIAETQLPGLDTLGTIGITAVLAALLFRYVFRLLEDYRKDLAAARDRADNLEEDLRKLGRSSARKAAAVRELTEYSHRLRLFIIAAGSDGEELPDPPEITGNGEAAN